MKNNVIKSIVFSLIFFLLLMITSFLFIPKNNLKEFGMDQVTANGILGEKENTIDVLVLGDSETYNSIIPMELYRKYGITSYICGTPGQRLFDSYRFLTTALEIQKPKIIVFETNAIYREYTLMSAIQAKWKLVFPVIKYHDRWKNLTINDFNGKINYTWTDDNKGYQLIKNVKPANMEHYMEYNQNVKKIPKLNVMYLEKIQKLCEENGIKLVLLSTPSTKNWNYEKHNGIEKYAKEKGIEYIDLNLEESLGIDWNKDTQDKGDHLNYVGAKKVTNYLADYFYKEDLPDHRGNSSYEGWNKALKKYKKKHSLT